MVSEALKFKTFFKNIFWGVSELMEMYDKLCRAAQVLHPVVSDLEQDHMRRLNCSWEILTKHLYQSVIYQDVAIQNNLPIFISQVR